MGRPCILKALFLNINGVFVDSYFTLEENELRLFNYFTMAL